MRIRVAALAGVVLATALSGASLAAPPKKPACNLVTDPVGEASWAGGKPKSLDLTGADITSDGKDITVIFKLSDVLDVDEAAPTGRKWVFTFNAANAPNPFYVMAWTDHGPNTIGTMLANFGRLAGKTETGGPKFEPGGSGLTVKADKARKQIRVHLPASSYNAFGVTLKGGTVASGLQVYTYASSNPAIVGVNGVHNWITDTAQSGLKYTLGAPHCEKVNI